MPLWIAHALLAAMHPARPYTGLAIDRLARQRRNFRGQNPAGLSWLAARMQRWPDGFREACWIGWEELLIPPEASAAIIETDTRCSFGGGSAE
jgi:hypothetical protein